MSHCVTHTLTHRHAVFGSAFKAERCHEAKRPRPPLQVAPAAGKAPGPAEVEVHRAIRVPWRTVMLMLFGDAFCDELSCCLMKEALQT